MNETPVADEGASAQGTPPVGSFHCPRLMMVVCPLFFAAQITFVAIMLRRTARIERALKALTSTEANP